MLAIFLVLHNLPLELVYFLHSSLHLLVCSVHFSCSVMSDSLWPQGLQHTRPPCPSSTPGALTHIHRVSDAIQTSHRLSSPSPPASIPPSIRFFSNESVLIRWPRYWNFSFNISPYNEHSGLISFRMDCLAILVVQGTLKSLQHHSSKASILRLSAFFIVQLSYPYMTTGKTTALTRQAFVGEVMSLCFNMLSRLVILFFQGESVF